MAPSEEEFFDKELGSRLSSSSNHDRHVQGQRQNGHEQIDKEAQIEGRPAAIQDPASPPLPPDGGLHAWLKVFGGFMIYINIW